VTFARVGRSLVAVALGALLGWLPASCGTASPPPGPTDAQRESGLRGLIADAGIEGVVEVSVIDGWPYLQLADVGAFESSFHDIAGLAPLRDGGSYSVAGGEHLTIVHIPARTSDHAIDEIIAIARDYPDAEVLLQATTAGPQWPELYVARLTAEDVTAVEKRLRDPSLADADREGYPVEFVLSTITADGPAYTTGTFGDVSP
jgi:hypothetical protein